MKTVDFERKLLIFFFGRNGKMMLSFFQLISYPSYSTSMMPFSLSSAVSLLYLEWYWLIVDSMSSMLNFCPM